MSTHKYFRKNLYILLVILIGFFVVAQWWLTRKSSPVIPPGIPSGVASFSHSAIGGISFATLETGTLPYKLIQAAHILSYGRSHHKTPALTLWPEIVSQYGILSPKRLEFADGQDARSTQVALGLVHEEIAAAIPPLRIDGVNLGCALCHAGVTYDQRGYPRSDTVRIGSPNTSFNPEGYIQATYAALQFGIKDQTNLWQVLNQLFPEMSWWEIATLKWVVIPAIEKQMNALSQGLDRPFPFSSGGPGLTNGIAALKFRLGLIDGSKTVSEVGFTSIPEIADRDQRTSLLYDGLYRPRDSIWELAPAVRPVNPALEKSKSNRKLSDIVAFFMVPTMGIMPDKIPESQDEVYRVFEDAILTHRPQSFPGPIDDVKAHIGSQLYSTHCASCHGKYEGSLKPGFLRLTYYPNYFSKLSDIRTDPERSLAADDALVKKISQMTYQTYMTIEPHQAYTATILTGLWASAPYLHNGSVPTLWHLMHPDQRPAKFKTGGHALDFDKVGIAGEMRDGIYDYPQSYRPWSLPEAYDATTPGRSNRGHEEPFQTLSDQEKQNLLEYLKLL